MLTAADGYVMVSEDANGLPAGETVEVTDHGHPIARIVPLHAEQTLDQLVVEGRATEALGDLLALEPIAAAKGEPRLSDVLAEMRADER